jgi:hypothetical protein
VITDVVDADKTVSAAT